MNSLPEKAFMRSYSKRRVRWAEEKCRLKRLGRSRNRASELFMMTRPRKKTLVMILGGALCLAPPIVAGRQKAAHSKPLKRPVREVVWRDPGDPAALDLFYGAGGAKDAPRP